MVLGANPTASIPYAQGEVVRYTWSVDSDDTLVPAISGPVGVASGFMTMPLCVPVPPARMPQLPAQEPCCLPFVHEYACPYSPAACRWSVFSPVRLAATSAFVASHAGWHDWLRDAVPCTACHALAMTLAACVCLPIGSGIAGGSVGPSGIVYSPAADTIFISDTLGSAIQAVEGASTCGSATGAACEQMVLTSGGLLNGPIGLCSTPNGNLVTPNVRADAVKCVLTCRCGSCTEREHASAC
jgi:hypothetical protein